MVLASLCTRILTSLFRRREDERERDREHRRRDDRPRDRRDDRDRDRDGRSRSSADNSDLRHRLNRDRYVTVLPTALNLPDHYFANRNMTLLGIVVTATDMWWRGRTGRAAGGRGAATQRTRTLTSGLFRVLSIFKEVS